MKDTPIKLLFSGIILFIAGLAFILHKIYGAAFLNIALPLICFLSGVFMLILSISSRGKTWNFITGVFLCLTCALLICYEIIFPGVEFRAIWPVFMFLFGLIVFIYSIRGKQGRNVKIMVPSMAICILALIFLPFSLKLITMSLFRFVEYWWPVIFCILGLILLSVYFWKSMKRKK